MKITYVEYQCDGCGSAEHFCPPCTDETAKEYGWLIVRKKHFCSQACKEKYETLEMTLKGLSAAQKTLVQAQEPWNRERVAGWLKDHIRVDLVYEKTAGVWLYWVMGPDSFSLGCFQTLPEARKFINQMKFTLTRERVDESNI